MAEEHFADIGRVEAITSLYQGTGYKPFEINRFTATAKGTCITC